jgi:hypothetical protein
VAGKVGSDGGAGLAGHAGLPAKYPDINIVTDSTVTAVTALSRQLSPDADR